MPATALPPYVGLYELAQGVTIDVTTRDEALSAATAQDAPILSYRGDGTFLMLAQGRASLTPGQSSRVLSAMRRFISN